MKDCMDKFNKNCLLSLIVVIGVLNVNQVFALDGYQAPLETIQNKEEPDPLIALNTSFRSAYADLRVNSKPHRRLSLFKLVTKLFFSTRVCALSQWLLVPATLNLKLLLIYR